MYGTTRSHKNRLISWPSGRMGAESDIPFPRDDPLWFETVQTAGGWCCWCCHASPSLRHTGAFTVRQDLCWLKLKAEQWGKQSRKANWMLCHWKCRLADTLLQHFVWLIAVSNNYYINVISRKQYYAPRSRCTHTWDVLHLSSRENPKIIESFCHFFFVSACSHVCIFAKHSANKSPLKWSLMWL